MGRHEVAHPDRAHPPLGEEPLQRPVGVHGAVEVAGERVVEDEQVDVVDAQLPAALVEGVQRLIVSKVADPHLRLDEDVGSVEPTATHCLADGAFVHVGGRGVDEPITGAQRGRNRFGRLLRRGLEDAETEGRSTFHRGWARRR